MSLQKMLDYTLEFLLPTKLTALIAGSTISLAGLSIWFPEFLQKISIQLTPEKTLLLRIAMPLSLLFLGTFIVLLFVLKYYKSEAHLAPLKEQLSAIEKEEISLRDQNRILASENAILKKENVRYCAEGLFLKNQINQIQIIQNTLSGPEHEILKLFKEYSHGISQESVSRLLSIDDLKAEYYLDELLNRKLLSTRYEKFANNHQPTRLYIPTQSGKEYIIRNKLI
ncbi:MAG: hypothetical protein JJE30_11325 [Desulfuromonadales bacterium]|nr:hypothetical protein [Desulfuromonadales bacterium]